VSDGTPAEVVAGAQRGATGKTFEILTALADGRPHSGGALATTFGISRAAIWERVQRLREMGADIYAVSGKGYQLARAFEFLDAAAIEAQLGAPARAVLAPITVAATVDSTNQRLLEASAARNIHGEAWLAEFQTAGRGRRGDRWLAPPGAAVCLSLGWRFEAQPRDLSTLSLVVGIAIARGLKQIGAVGLGLKWPNDLLLNGRKLAGILSEMRSELGGPCTVVIGVGVNVALGPALQAQIDQPVASLADACEIPPSRNAVAAALLNALTATLAEFAQSGFAGFVPAWRALDALADRSISLTLPDRDVLGVARGVDANGLLLIETHGRTESFLSGHVRLREAG